MSVSQLSIHIPPQFDITHEEAVGNYLTNRLSGREAWAHLFEAFDILDGAILVTGNKRLSFRSVYREAVDEMFADTHINSLLILKHVRVESPPLWARFARRIVEIVTERGWRRSDIPETRLLLAYLLYWWNAFARGYALEVEIFRDLEQSGITFTAHDLRDRNQRFSPSDLVVLQMSGDIKTSVYFVQAAASLIHDFYIVRLVMRDQEYTLVTMLQPDAWDQINGDTVSGDIMSVMQHFPAPVEIRHRGHRLVVLEYNEWKRRVLGLQGGIV